MVAPAAHLPTPDTAAVVAAGTAGLALGDSSSSGSPSAFSKGAAAGLASMFFLSRSRRMSFFFRAAWHIQSVVAFDNGMQLSATHDLKARDLMTSSVGLEHLQGNNFRVNSF